MQDNELIDTLDGLVLFIKEHCIDTADPGLVWFDFDKAKQAIKDLFSQREDRAYKQGWDSAGGELLDQREAEIRIDEIKNIPTTVLDKDSPFRLIRIHELESGTADTTGEDNGHL